jgi:nucleotide-binding universal stress UspA family protein
MYERIIWATDGSEGANVALAEALRLAESSGSGVIAVHCDQRLDGRAGGWPALADEDDRRLQIRRQVRELQANGVDIDLVIRRSHQEAADTVAAVAAEFGGDLIVCGTRGLGAFGRFFLGSFTQRLLQIAPCPVLAVPERDAIEAPRENEKAQANA